MGKRTRLVDYRPQKRGGTGLRTMNITDKTGVIVSTQVVDPDDEVMMISRNGNNVKFSVKEIRSTGRSTQGVRLMNLDFGDELASVERIPNTKEADEAVAAREAEEKSKAKAKAKAEQDS